MQIEKTVAGVKAPGQSMEKRRFERRPGTDDGISS